MVRLMKKLFSYSRSSSRDQAQYGKIRVCVGKCSSPRRFELEANYLKHPLVEGLLELSGEEFGYSYNGALRIACDVELFLHLLQLLRSRDPTVHYMELTDLLAKFYGTPEAAN